MKAVKRPTLDQYFIKIAKVVATRSTCLHRQTGAVLVVDRHIVSTGYNGSPPGQPHSTDVGWCGKDRTGICRAEGCHAESNAVAWAARSGIKTGGATLYTVYSPCRACCNLLSVSGVERVVYKEVYDHFPGGPSYLKNLGIAVKKV